MKVQATVVFEYDTDLPSPAPELLAWLQTLNSARLQGTVSDFQMTITELEKVPS